MDLQPVKRYAGPALPTRATLDAHPELLRVVPKRWRKNAVVLAAMAATGSLLAVCADSGHSETTAASPIVARTAPLFPQLDGRGMLRGDMPTPQFLSEEDARQVIVEEARLAGIAFTPDCQTVPNVPVRMVPDPGSQEQENGGTAQGSPARQTQRISLALDGTDTERHIAYEYVSTADLDAWHAEYKQRVAPGYAFDGTRAAAETIREGLTQGVPAGTYAFFYDPGFATPETAKEALRQQVRDFITWLKAEGVI